MLTIVSQCWLCQQPLYHNRHGICCYCQRHLPVLPPCCPCCGLPSTSTFLRCGRCLIAPPRWHHMMFVGDYAPPLSGLIKQLKFGGAPNWPPCWLVYYYYDGYATGGRPDAVIMIRSSSHNGSSVSPYIIGAAGGVDTTKRIYWLVHWHTGLVAITPH